MNNIVCPHCGKVVELTQAFKHEIEEKIRITEKEKHQKELEEVKKQAIDQSTKRLQEQFALQLKFAKDDSASKDEQIKEFIKQITKLNEAVRQSKKEKDQAELEMQKKLLEEEDKIRLDAQKKAEEEQRLKFLEKEKQLQDALKSNEEMRRKLTQGSQQSQGEVFEQTFEENLKHQYRHDKILPVGKGIKGADIVQEVWDRNGNFVGKILWELKNTKTWNEEWIAKLKNDKRTINAEEAVLISVILPTDMKNAGFRDSIWVTQEDFVFPLADTLRAKLIQLFYIRNSVKAKDEKMEILYTYLTGTEFKYRVEAIIEAFSNMQKEIEKEKRYFSSKWARDEKNIRQVIDNTYGMHGDLKGIMGNTLPQIKNDMLELEDGDD
ncbi:MAG: DUF2130 domain-containing protein [Candidatus Levybacteria bacterium]|nr:DUF2130 domain-containing protein [Candidatus Levybacteria bacterium]